MQEDKWEVVSKEDYIKRILDSFIEEVANVFDNNMRFDDDFETLISAGSTISLSFDKDEMSIHVKHKEKEVENAKSNDHCRTVAGFTV